MQACDSVAALRGGGALAVLDCRAASVQRKRSERELVGGAGDLPRAGERAWPVLLIAHAVDRHPPRPFPRPRHRGRAVAAPPLCTVDIRLGRSQIVQDEAVASVLTPATRAQSSETRES